MDSDQLLSLLLVVGQSPVIGAVLMPPLIAAINRVAWPKPAKAAVALVSSVLAGGAAAWAAGELTGLSAATRVQLAAVCAGIVARAAHEAYRRWWKPTGVGDWIETTINAGPLAVVVEAARHRVDGTGPDRVAP